MRKADLKTAFVVWNAFQVVQFANLYKAFPSAAFIVVEQPYNENFFSDPFIKESGFSYKWMKKNEIRQMDGIFDVIFFQAPFPGIETFSLSRLVSLQYGLAKERHNYGEWRSLADLNLMYGEYSVKKVEHFSPSEAVGNPKFEGFDRANAVEVRKRFADRWSSYNPDRPTVLFMPTWGELSSFTTVIPVLGNLQKEMNVIVKIHHNEGKKADQTWQVFARGHGIDLLFDGSADQQELLLVSDLAVSDFSGAIFDAVFAKIPVVLVQIGVESLQGKQKFDLETLEYVRRTEIGLVCNDTTEIEVGIRSVMTSSAEYVSRAAALRKELFADEELVPSSVNRIVELTLELVCGNIPQLSQPQKYVRSAVKDLIKNKSHKRPNLKTQRGLVIRSYKACFVAFLLLSIMRKRYKTKFFADSEAFFRDSRNRFVKRLSTHF